MKTLTICHFLHLTKEEIKSWYSGIKIEVVGFYLFDWEDNSKHSKEIFCKYKLIKEDNKTYVNFSLDGFKIGLPNEVDLVEGNPRPMIKSLFNVKDGGSNWLSFVVSKNIKKKKTNIRVINFVEIKPIEVLLESIL